MPDQDKRRDFVPLEKGGGKPARAALPKINICGDIGLKIGRDGTWYYRGSPIERKPLVKLFASVLAREDDGSYWLVTPVEKVPIEVEAAPFLAVEMWQEGSGTTMRLSFRTNVGDVVAADREHPLSFQAAKEGEPVPSVLVRHGLKARLSRAVYYELAALAVEGDRERRELGVWSGGMFFPFPPLGSSVEA
jgi:hypothetical protein